MATWNWATGPSIDGHPLSLDEGRPGLPAPSTVLLRIDRGPLDPRRPRQPLREERTEDRHGDMDRGLASPREVCSRCYYIFRRLISFFFFLLSIFFEKKKMKKKRTIEKWQASSRVRSSRRHGVNWGHTPAQKFHNDGRRSLHHLPQPQQKHTVRPLSSRQTQSRGAKKTATWAIDGRPSQMPTNKNGFLATPGELILPADTLHDALKQGGVAILVNRITLPSLKWMIFPRRILYVATSRRRASRRTIA